MKQAISYLSFSDFLTERNEEVLYDGLIVLQTTKRELLENWRTIPSRIDYLGACLVRTGSFKMFVNFKEYTFSAGDMIFLSPNQVTQMLNYSDDIELLGVFTDLDFFQEVGLPMYKAFSMESLSPEIDSHISLNAKQKQRFIAYIENLKLQNIATGDTLFKHEIIKMTLMLFFYEINAIRNSNLAKAMPGFEHKNKMVMDFLTLASKNFKKSRSIQFYADELFISRKHLTRIVKEVTGAGPKSILDEIVIAEAVILLNISALTVKDVMHELNFTDFGSFSKFFKNYLGKSPLAYRSEIAAKGVSSIA
ncbi:helix-turn-helix domain-containing protein [Sphingobacterium sp. MYb382]|uniref:helix-turn-helix domain-containing protein n=1 Tax=Sphingobacterium sp. MYb382 TaxID=2745278 RepID=UPI0030A993A8